MTTIKCSQQLPWQPFGAVTFLCASSSTYDMYELTEAWKRKGGLVLNYFCAVVTHWPALKVWSDISPLSDSSALLLHTSWNTKYSYSNHRIINISMDNNEKGLLQMHSVVTLESWSTWNTWTLFAQTVIGIVVENKTIVMSSFKKYIYFLLVVLYTINEISMFYQNSKNSISHNFLRILLIFVWMGALNQFCRWLLIFFIFFFPSKNTHLSIL